LSGCTTASDHHYVFPPGLESAIEIQACAAADLGMRLTLTRGSMNLSVKDGGLPPESVVQDGDTILADSERVIDAFHDPSPGSMIQIALAPCSPFSVTREIMSDTAALADRKNVGLHTHLAETEDENDFCQEMFGCRPLDYLENVGWMTERTWLAHGIHFSDDEISRLGAAGVGIAHCPGSNMVLASGICRGRELEQAGAPVGIGVDGSASEDASNLIQEARMALQIQRLRYGAGEISHKDVLRWATAGSAKCLGRGDIGEISVGKQADFAFFKLDEPRFSGAGDPLAALILCGAHRADRVMIAGDWRVIDGEIPGLDLAGLMAEHAVAADSLIA
jgi:8-oxoguanine deaminase